MAGKGPPPKDPEARRGRAKPVRGDWQPSPGVGWQHGAIPPFPRGITTQSQHAWRTWFTAWYAAHWTPSDLPSLRQLVRLYDAVERGDLVRATELRLAQDTWGITPKGQQDRRWSPPKPADTPVQGAAPAEAPGSRYGHLRSVQGGAG